MICGKIFGENLQALNVLLISGISASTVLYVLTGPVSLSNTRLDINKGWFMMGILLRLTGHVWPAQNNVHPGNMIECFQLLTV